MTDHNKAFAIEWPKDVLRLETALDEAEERARGAAERADALAERIVEGEILGEDVDALRAERRDAQQLAEDVREMALPRLRAKVEDARRLALGAEAERRLVGIARAVGSLKSALDEELAAFERVAALLVEKAGKLPERYAAVQQFQAEALFLASTFPDLQAPDLPTVESPATSPRVKGALARLRKVAVPRGDAAPRSLASVPGREASKWWARISGTPAAVIVEAAGGWGEDAHDARHEEAMRESRALGDRKRRDEAARVDQWLRDALADGPVERERIVEPAKAAGIPLGGSGHPRTLGQARQVLDVRLVHPVTSRPSSTPGSLTAQSVDSFRNFWALPGGWDPERFVEAEDRVESRPGAMR